MTGPAPDIWQKLTAPPPESVRVGATVVSVGQRVRLNPRAGGDVMDLALAGRSAVVEGIDVTLDDEPRFAVTIDDDPGRDLGGLRYPGHRFFFRADEVELIGEPNARSRPRILVAGIGNIFFGDDGFGVAVARQLASVALPPGVTVRDFGIRGLDLAYALQEDYDAAILVDAMPGGDSPGTIYTVEPQLDDAGGNVALNAHGMDPVRVLRLARSLGRVPARVVVLGCEPESLETNAALEQTLVALSPSVRAAVDDAVRMIVGVLGDLVHELTEEEETCRQQPGPGASSRS